MKGLMLGLLCLIGATASADTLLQLPVPTNAKTIAGPAYAHCATAGFNADGTVRGNCQATHSAACSGRGCQPVRMVYNFVASWGSDGYSLTSIQCSVTRRHVPQLPVTTYTPGYDAATCPEPNYNPTGTVVVINGVPYFYVSTDTNGNEVVNSNYAGFLFIVGGAEPDYGKFE